MQNRSTLEPTDTLAGPSPDAMRVTGALLLRGSRKIAVAIAP